jgi:hypothetical protein
MTQPKGALPDNAAILVPDGSFDDVARAIFDVLGPSPTLKVLIDEQVRAAALLQWARRQHGPQAARDEWTALVELIAGLATQSGSCPPPAEGCS